MKSSEKEKDLRSGQERGRRSNYESVARRNDLYRGGDFKCPRRKAQRLVADLVTDVNCQRLRAGLRRGVHRHGNSEPCATCVEFGHDPEVRIHLSAGGGAGCSTGCFEGSAPRHRDARRDRSARPLRYRIHVPVAADRRRNLRSYLVTDFRLRRFSAH